MSRARVAQLVHVRWTTLLHMLFSMVALDSFLDGAFYIFCWFEGVFLKLDSVKATPLLKFGMRPFWVKEMYFQVDGSNVFFFLASRSGSNHIIDGTVHQRSAEIAIIVDSDFLRGSQDLGQDRDLGRDVAQNIGQNCEEKLILAKTLAKILAET